MKISGKLIVAFGAMVGAAVALTVYPNQMGHETEHVHYHAGFRIYIDDYLQDYSGYQHMNYTPCSEHDHKKSPEEEQLEKAHLHDGVGDVVHVHRTGAVWGDLLVNSKIELPSKKEVEGFVDGLKQENILTTPIEPYTTAIFLVGESRSERSAERVERAHIEEVEAKSELCGV
jgi:hypothetical protein